MPAKTPRQPKPKVPLPAFRVRYGQQKQAEREAKEAERKAAILARAEKYPDMRDEIMAIYEKPARKTTVKEREAMLAGWSPEAAALSRRLNDAVKKLPKLPKKKKA